MKGYPLLGATIEHAIITDNDVTMSVAEGREYGAGSAGIEIIGSARGIVIQGNQIRGRAKIALSVRPDKSGTPVETRLERNDSRNLVTPLAEGEKLK